MKRAALVLLLAGACTFAVQENHFFHPGPARSKSRAVVGEDHAIPSAGGVSLGAVYVRRDAPVDVLYFGGDSFYIDDHGTWLAAALHPVGANLFIVDHRGYGRSGGTPTLAVVKQDVLVAYDYLDAMNGSRPIVVHGFSLGSFLAGHAAANRPVAGLVLESTATDVESWAKTNVPGYARAVVRVDIAEALKAESNVSVVKAYGGPLLLMTGANDRITPPRFAQELFAHSATPADRKRVLIAGGRGHGDVLVSPEAVEAYRTFVATITGPPGPPTASPGR
ncbi:MAG TPA: alpha/beta fold hydrolase [Thermoanaerobaculia bacterium]|nr:alpha/beta fold hydrolase [Thermoanaerobaculia bacterium]